jgi:hypothetical protein
MKNAFSLLTIAACALSLGCTFIARGPEDYKVDTRGVLETQNRAIKECYDVELATNPASEGTVVVTFIVEKKTGKIMNAAVDEAQTKASPVLSQCVVSAIDGLQLDPPDQREGQATFSYRFKANKPAPAEGA